MTDKEQIAMLRKKLQVYAHACFRCGEWDGESNVEYKVLSDFENSVKEDIVAFFEQAAAHQIDRILHELLGKI